VTALLTVKDLRVAFRQDGKLTEAVKGVSFAVERGETVALVGESGSGKSVSALSTVALLGDSAEVSGSVTYDGQQMIGADEALLRKVRGNDISFIFQEPMTSLNPLHTIEKQLGESLALHQSLTGAAARTRILELMDKVGIHDAESRLSAYPHQLSGGQRQRVAMGRALVRDAGTFLFDEPLSNLDAKLRGQMRAELAMMHQRVGKNMIYVTHDQIEAMTLADRVVVMEKGVVQQVGTPTDIYDQPANTFVASFIGSPAMNLLEGTLEGGTFTGKDVKIDGIDSTHSGPVTLGYRAEDAIVNGENPAIDAPVYSMELLGDATMVTFRVGGTIATVKADKDFRAKIGENVRATIPAGICHLFNATTGERL